MENQKLPTPITCPICGSRELAFVHQDRKCIISKGIQSICLHIATILFLVGLIPSKILKDWGVATESISGMLAFFIFCYIALSFFIYLNERKSHICTICKDCGHIWTLD